MQLTFDEAKRLIGQAVKVVIPDFVTEKLHTGDVYEAVLVGIKYSGYIELGIDTVSSFSCDVDVADSDGGIHHILVNDVYDEATKHKDAKQIDLAERIEELTVDLDRLNKELEEAKSID
jgi:hypothetical protein